jgi:CRP-like cAMP-binding protein
LLEPVTLADGDILSVAGVTPKELYFIDAGLVSMVGHTASGSSLELACLGNEALTHASWLLSGAPPPYSFFAQSTVKARRLAAADAARILGTAHARGQVVDKFCQFLIALLSQSALCARFHTVVQRLARRLLVTCERAGTPVISLTHENMAQMVGATRSLVTEAISVLRRSGCIESRRGVITIVSAKALKRHACECYAADWKRRLALEERVLAQASPSPRSRRSSARLS